MNRLGAVLQQLRKISAKKESCKLQDQELLRCFVAHRDEAAFEVLVARHGPMVLNVCRRVLPEQGLVEDAFQATFLVLVRKAGSIGKRELLTNWLYGVAYRTAARAKVEAAKRRAREKAVPPKQGPDPLAEISARELLTVLDEELSALPAQYRGPLVLCYLEGKTRDEAAHQFGWSLATLARRLERGREMLKARLDRRGLGLPMTLFAVVLTGGIASASVPPSLAASAVTAAVLAIGGKTMTAGVISTNVGTLTEGVLKTMFIARLKTAMAMLLLAGMLGAGVGTAVFNSQTQAQPPASGPSAPAATKKEPHAEGDEFPRLEVWNRVTVPDKLDAPKEKKAEKPQVTRKPVVVREGALLQRMAMSPNTEVMATVGVTRDGLTFNSTVKLWDVRNGKLWRVPLAEEKDSHLELAFSKVYLAIGVNGKLQDTDPRGPREVRLLDRTTLKLNHKIDGTLVPGLRSWTGLAFSRNGKRLALAGIAEGAFVKLWDVEKQKLIEGKVDLGDIPPEQNEVVCLAFSPDGQLVAAAWRDTKVRLFDGQTGDFKTLLDPKLKPAEFTHGITGIAFSPDSKTLASKGGDNTVVLWDLTEGKPRRTLKGHKGQVNAVAFSNDGRWIATGGATAKVNVWEVILWDAKTGEAKQSFPKLTEPVNAVGFSPDSKTLAVCGGGGRGNGENTTMTGEITLIRLE